MIIPLRGDLIWLDFDPQAGREQAGRRPALVLSEQAFNELTGFAVICPINSKVWMFAKKKSKSLGMFLSNRNSSKVFCVMFVQSWHNRKAASLLKRACGFSSHSNPNYFTISNSFSKLSTTSYFNSVVSRLAKCFRAHSIFAFSTPRSSIELIDPLVSATK